MKLLRRNTTEFTYRAPDGVDTDLNEFEEHTGEYRREYAEPVEYRGNISIPSGQSVWEFYGLDTNYTHTLVMDKPDADIREGGIIQWMGETYDIIAVRRSINAVSVALRKQTSAVPADV